MRNEVKGLSGKSSKYTMQDRHAFLFCAGLLAVPLSAFLFFWCGINFSSIILAFKAMDGSFTVSNFGTVFDALGGNDIYSAWDLGEIMGRTFFLWLCVDIICVVPSLFTSYVLYKDIPGAPFFRIVFMIPTILAGIVWVMAMKSMVGVSGSTSGPIIAICNKVGIEFQSGDAYEGPYPVKIQMKASAIYY